MENQKVECPINPGCDAKDPAKCDVSKCPILMDVKRVDSPNRTRRYSSGMMESRSRQVEN